MEFKRNYWGYRICNESSTFFYEELKEGRLRQGWGYNIGQDLRKLTYDEGASKNLKMLNVKKGDILLVPRIPSWEDICIVEATEDWNTGYKFDIPKDQGDFGHIFPARIITSINRYNSIVSDELRSSFHCLLRFWSLDSNKDNIDKIIQGQQEKIIDIPKDNNTNSPNIFSYATSELSQDAFLLWILNWANPKYKEIDNELYLTAQNFVRLLLGEDQSFSISSVRTYKQLKNIDVFAIINEKESLIIEDKVNTGTHDNQLKRYKEWISSQNVFNNLNLRCVYLKTGNESFTFLRNIEQEENYNLVLRKDLINIFDKCKSNNNILVDFYRHLETLENETNSYKVLPVEKWSYDAWQGFYMELEQSLNIDVKHDAWFYVPNQSGGFLGFNWHWKSLPNCRVYLQFEQGPLCIKIECYDSEKRAEIRNYWSETIIQKAKDNGLDNVVKPNRFGNGDYMTIALISAESLFVEKIINMERLIFAINNIEKLIDEL